MPVRILKYGSLVLSIAGLALLFLVATRSQVPVIEISDLAGTMNWAYVRVDGTVSRPPTNDSETGTLRFWVWDGTGELLILAYRSEAEVMQAEGRVPAIGDGVALEGTVHIREEFPYLVVDVPTCVEVRSPDPIEVSCGAVDAGIHLQRVTVRGVIRDDRVPYEGLRILTVRDATGGIDVTLPTGVGLHQGDWPDLALGQSVQVTGAVDLYQGRPQLAVGHVGDLVAMDEPITIAQFQRIDELSPVDVGGLARVEGTITRVESFSAGVKLTLDDGSGTITLLLWQDLYQSLAAPGSFVEGSEIRALGQVNEYRGDLEIVPELPMDVEMVAASEGVTEQRVIPERHLGELTAADIGSEVMVEGVLQSLRSFSAGVKGRLDDGTGTMTLLLWQEVYDGLSDPASLAPGAMLRVEGEISEYRGTLEVVPWAPADVNVLGSVDLPGHELALGQISTDDLGQTVWVKGQIVSESSFSNGIKYVLDDGTGTIALLLWQDVYNDLGEPGMLAEGAEVLVWGEVAEFGGELEIVPQVSSAIEVTVPGESAQLAPGSSPTPTASATPEATPTPTPEPAAKLVPSPTAPAPTSTIEPRTISSITSKDVGDMFTIAQAGIVDVTYFSKGVKYTLNDATGNIVLLVWQNLLEGITDRRTLYPGSQVRVVGEIDLYQGVLEIVPQTSADVAVLVSGDRLPVEERAANNITPSDEGRSFVVEGVVTRTESSGWLKLWLSDGTGEILIFVPQRVVDYLPAGIGAGVRLRVTGEVDIYQGQIEVIPLVGADVEVR
jgi:DNA/RNA endonuclease YhcR with UshA esterase domain